MICIHFVLNVSIKCYFFVRLWWLVILILSLCMGAADTNHQQDINPKVFYILMDDRFTPQQKKYIQSAANHWINCSEGKVQVTFIITHMSSRWKDHPLQPNTISLWIIPLSAGELGKERYNHSFKNVAEVVVRERGAIDMLVYRNLTDDDFTMVMMHEFGHLFGIDHTDQKNTLMFPSVEGQKPCIDPEIAKEFCSQYGCSGKGDCY